jgi:hypothetical protein
MAVLSEEDRQRIWRGLMRYWSRDFTSVDLSKSELRSAVDATDTWIENNQASYNQALPATAQSNLDANQKTLLFCAVALMRVDPGLANLLRRALGVEVN